MSDEITKCPKCGYSEGFDISSADGCYGKVHELHCWNCDCHFNPNTGEIRDE